LADIGKSRHVGNLALHAYAQSAGITLTEVLATLLIVALGLLQVRGPMASE